MRAARLAPTYGTRLELRMVLAARAYWTSRTGDRQCALATSGWTCHTTPVTPACGQPMIRRVWGAWGTRVQPNSWAYVLPRNVPACIIDIVGVDWTPADERAEYPLLCRMMAHEYGHLLGIWDEGTGSMLAHIITSRVPDRYCSRDWRG